jgi:hypothetical protein
VVSVLWATAGAACEDNSDRRSQETAPLPEHPATKVIKRIEADRAQDTKHLVAGLPFISASIVARGRKFGTGFSERTLRDSDLLAENAV